MSLNKGSKIQNILIWHSRVSQIKILLECFKENKKSEGGKDKRLIIFFIKALGKETMIWCHRIMQL